MHKVFWGSRDTFHVFKLHEEPWSCRHAAYRSAMVTSTSTPGSMLRGATGKDRGGARQPSSYHRARRANDTFALRPRVLLCFSTYIWSAGRALATPHLLKDVVHSHTRWLAAQALLPAPTHALTTRPAKTTKATSPRPAHLIEVICLTTSAGECRSMRRLWILHDAKQAGKRQLRPQCLDPCLCSGYVSRFPQLHTLHSYNHSGAPVPDLVC